MKSFFNILILLTCSLLLPANEHAYRILSFVEDVKQSVISLNGAWQYRFAPSGKWETAQAPGDLTMQGFAIEQSCNPITLKHLYNS